MNERMNEKDRDKKSRVRCHCQSRPPEFAMLGKARDEEAVLGAATRYKLCSPI
jgi:hypothetical protein